MQYIIKTLTISIFLSSLFLNGTNNTTLPLHEAIKNNDIETLKPLLKNQEIDLNQQDLSGNSALYFAVQENNFEAVRLLLNAGAEVNITNNESSTPIQRAAYVGNYEIVALLLRYNADPNITNKIGNTALHCAAKICRLLSFFNQHDLTKYNESEKWESLEDIIKSNDDKEIIEVFTKNAQEKLKIIKLLLEYGANKDIKNEVPCKPIGVIMAKKGTKTLEGQTAADMAMTQEIKDFLNSTIPEKKRCFKKVFFVSDKKDKQKQPEHKPEELHPGVRMLYFTIGSCLGTLTGIALSVCCWYLYKKFTKPVLSVNHLSQKQLSLLAVRPLTEALKKVL